MSLSIRLHSIRCLDEKNEESASEEPYVLVTAAKLGPLPNVRVKRYGIWEDFDEGETVTDGGAPFWGLNGSAEEIPDPRAAGFVVSLLENDNGSPDQYQGFVETAATISLGSTAGEPDANVRMAVLTGSIQRALDGIDMPIPFALDDDHVGTAELRLDQADLVPFGSRDRVLRIASGEGDYELTFRISRTTFRQELVAPPLQGDWRFCGKCMAQFFDGFPQKGVCPAGGGHEAAGLRFVLPHDMPPTPNLQPGWRFCGRCSAMFFEGFPDQGVCAAGGAHSAAGLVFSLPHDTDGGPTGQPGWRFCGKCKGLFFDGFEAKGVCPAGAAHEAAGFTFVLPHLPG